MYIHILQQAISLNRSFNIAINEKKKYSAEGYSYWLFSSYRIYTQKKQLVSIYKNWYSFFPSFNIYFNDETISTRKKPLKLRTTSYIKNSYKCIWDENSYEIFAHKGLKFSIFRNGVQIAGIDQDRWTSFKEDGFKMECNNDVHKEFITSLIIILDHIHNNQIQFLWGLFAFNLGVLFEAKKYDLKWKSQ